MSIYDIPAIVKEALPLAMTPLNILSGFQITEIFPFNRNIFQDIEFAPSIVTDRVIPSVESAAVEIASTLAEANKTQDASINKTLVSKLESLKPFSKAALRKNPTRKARQKGKAAILTDSDVRNDLLEKELIIKTKQDKKIKSTDYVSKKKLGKRKQ